MAKQGFMLAACKHDDQPNSPATSAAIQASKSLSQIECSCNLLSTDWQPHIALEYATRGAIVVLVARREHLLREVAAKCMANGARDAAICPADVSKQDECKRIVDFTISNFGKLDILVNNAGTAKSGLFAEQKNTDDVKAIMDLDFWGNTLTTKYALNQLRRVRGQVVVISSVAAFVPYPKQAIYNAAKSAIVQFYDTIRAEPVGQDITITVVLPGFVESELTKGGPKDHIPSWWPMLSTPSAARAIVEAAVAGKRYHIVPFWYATWLPYKVFAPELLEWPPRMFLLGKPPTRAVETICNTVLGKDNTQKLFRALPEWVI
ncbi:hypothetical protein O6H91_12G035200 [Diphasiastrum complanatum]|uniref:Uncharacterized protein n=1 Tax=Diphasiastrum complanatum TaxID=34168 RepID=A0ACC2C0T1_DIPCM|nr:hypothetical protein O6H91_12G035200 [Diphasiastrum complanatum]